MTTMHTTEDLDALIARRDALKSNIDSHLRFDKSVDAPGDDLRDELGQVVGAITTALHKPFAIEGDRLRQKRQEIAAELEQSHHERAQLRCRLGAAQGQRATTLTAGDDATDHLVSSKALAVDLEALEETIAHLEHRARGVDSRLTELTVAEGAQMVSGVSAT
jgi:hypothetical protein